MVNTPLIFMGISGISFAVAGLLSSWDSVPGSLFDSQIKPSIERVLVPGSSHSKELLPDYRSKGDIPAAPVMKKENGSRRDRADNFNPVATPVPAGASTPLRQENKDILTGCFGSVSALADREASRIPRSCIATNKTGKVEING